MALRIVNISLAPDPLAAERESHRAFALAAALEDVSALIEAQGIQLTRALDLGFVNLRIKGVPEYHFAFVDASAEWGVRGDNNGEDQYKGREDSQGGGVNGGNKEDSEGADKSPSNLNSSRFGEQSSGVGQSQSAKLGQELGRVHLSPEGANMHEYGFDHRPEDEGEIEFSSFGDGCLQAGDNPGEVAFEENISIEIFLDALAHEFHLPLLHTTNLGALRAPTQGRPYGIRPRGPQAQLHKRRTSERRLKRVGEREDEGFADDDLSYIRRESRDDFRSNAVVIFVRDSSGTVWKEEIISLIRAFSMHTLRAIRREYDKVDFIFITFDTKALRHSGDKAEWEFFHRQASGGTIISSGLSEASAILQKEYPDNQWNKFVFLWSDGDTSGNPEEKNPDILRQAIKKIAPLTDIFGYFEIGEIGLTSISSDPVLEERGGLPVVLIDSGGNIRNTSNELLKTVTALKYFFEARNDGHANIFAVRFGNRESAGRAFKQLMEFFERRREEHER